VPARTPEVAATAGEPVTVDLLPAELNLILYSGDTVEMRFQFTDAGGVPVDMTGTWTAQVRTAPDTLDPPLADFAVDESQAAAGVIDIGLTPEQTQALPPSSSWDLQMTTSPDHIHTTHRGTITITEDVTRP
jgi:hypothetical protein